MSKLRVNIGMSLDGYISGPNPSEENPLGTGGANLHSWLFALKRFRESHGQDGGEINASTAVTEKRGENLGATIIGRNWFGPDRGPWPTDSWRTGWGQNPPFHNPVFVVTHYPREPLEAVGVPVTFVTDGIESAMRQAKDAAGGQDVHVFGGASVVNQYLAAGLVDELNIALVPLILGGGARLFEGVEQGVIKLKQVSAIDAPGVTHLTYEVS
jgi:dihydrofolate reductase